MDPRGITRGIAFPPRLDPHTGRLAWSEGAESIRESIQILLLTNPGERIHRPRLGAGLSDFLYEPNNASTRRLIEERIVQTLNQWERRIELQSVLAEADPADRETVMITIEYIIIGSAPSQQVEKLTLRLSLSAGGGE